MQLALQIKWFSIHTLEEREVAIAQSLAYPTPEKFPFYFLSPIILALRGLPLAQVPVR
jgi:hypothetical protein